MKTKSLESQVIKKLNKILVKENLKIKIKKDGFVVMVIHPNQGTWERIGSAYWTSLKTMLFENKDEYTIFNDIRDGGVYVYAGLQAFQDLGLMSLENCASWEEMLLRLEVMFPEK